MNAQDTSLVRKMKAVLRKQDTKTLRAELEIQRSRETSARIVSLIEAELARRA